MKSAFRYSSQKYNDALMALGNIRIGTLHDFRRIEHKAGIADANEGKKLVTHHIPYANSDEVGTKHLEALKHFKAMDIDRVPGVTLRNVSVTRIFNLADCFVHCTSVEFSQKVMSQFEGADSCVEITDLRGFYRRLTETLNGITPVNFRTISKVNYLKREEKWNGEDWGVNPALIKEPSFRKQLEIRAIWMPKYEENISPIVVNDIGLIKYCRVREI